MAHKLPVNPVAHHVSVLNPEIRANHPDYMGADTLSAISRLMLRLTAVEEPRYHTTIVISRYSHSLLFNEVLDYLCYGSTVVYPGEVLLEGYVIMGNIIPVNAPFIFEDHTLNNIQ